MSIGTQACSQLKRQVYEHVHNYCVKSLINLIYIRCFFKYELHKSIRDFWQRRVPEHCDF